MKKRKEHWKEIEGYDGEYLISDLGRVKSLKREEEHILSPGITSKNHLGVGLCKDGIRRRHRVHRLVAEAFKPNPNILPIVRHLNDDPTDNRVENLEWGTQRDNVHDSINSGKHVFNRRPMDEEVMKLGNAAHRTPVKAVNSVTGEERLYGSQKEASEDLGICRPTLNQMIRGTRNIHNADGWTIEYAR